MVLDGGVTARLGDGGVVHFAVAVAAVADKVDDDIGVEPVTKLGGDGSDAHDRVGVLGVDVEDGDGQALGDVGGEARGVGLLRQGGEAEQIVDDDVDGAADFKAGQRAEDEAFGEDALAGEGGVAVHDDGQDLVAAGLIRTIEFRADSQMRVCLARERPRATGSTASRWLGFETRCSEMALPLGARYSPVAPMWYFTSPPPSTLRGLTSSKRAKISAGERPMVLVMTLRRPRWLMPMTAVLTPSVALEASTVSRKGISTVSPSSEKRLVPR